MHPEAPRAPERTFSKNVPKPLCFTVKSGAGDRFAGDHASRFSDIGDPNYRRLENSASLSARAAARAQSGGRAPGSAHTRRPVAYSPHLCACARRMVCFGTTPAHPFCTGRAALPVLSDAPLCIAPICCARQRRTPLSASRTRRSATLPRARPSAIRAAGGPRIPRSRSGIHGRFVLCRTRFEGCARGQPRSRGHQP